MRAFLAHLRDAYQAQGARLPLVAIRWLIRPEYLVTVRPASRVAPAWAGSDELRWVPLEEAHLPAILALSPTLTETEIRRLWAEGQECLTCWIDDTLVFFRWVTTEPAYQAHLHRTFLPGPGDLLGWGIYTHPAYRNRGLMSASSAAMMPLVTERGVRRVIALIAFWNAPSLHATVVKIGNTVAGTVGYWRVGPWRRPFATGAVRLVGRTGFRVEDLPGE